MVAIRLPLHSMFFSHFTLIFTDRRYRKEPNIFIMATSSMAIDHETQYIIKTQKKASELANATALLSRKAVHKDGRL